MGTQDLSDITDPADVHPEHDRPTADNMEDWSGDQIDRWNELNSQDLEAQARENMADLSAEQEETLAKLRSAVDDDIPTETVEFGDATLVVQAKLTGDIEDKIDRVRDAQAEGKLSSVADAMIDVITTLVVDDDEPASDPVDYQDPDVWRAFRQESGIEELARAFWEIVTPARERLEDLSFRGANGGGRDRGATR